MTRPFSLARSYLFAPGNRARLVESALRSDADVIVLDLEDAVPQLEKDAARQLVARVVREKVRAIHVRFNPVSSRMWRRDLECVVGPGLAGVRIAKVESADEVRAVDQALRELEHAADLKTGSIPIMPTIESARGLLAAAGIAAASGVAGLCFGQTDFARDIDAEPEGDGLSTLYAESHLVVVSRAAGIAPPVASVFTNLHDMEGLRNTSVRARRLGFFGRSCIHPSQLAVVRQVFTPTESEVAYAQVTLEEFRRATSAGMGTLAGSDGRFVDAAVAKRAEAILELVRTLNVGSREQES